MSVTKLKDVGRWYAIQDITASERTMRGRVITGMLTGGDESPDDPFRPAVGRGRGDPPP